MNDATFWREFIMRHEGINCFSWDIYETDNKFSALRKKQLKSFWMDEKNRAAWIYGLLSDNSFN